MRPFILLIFSFTLLAGVFFPTGKAQGVSSIITRSFYNQMLPNRNTFYTYDAFIEAANAFPGFGTTGGDATRRRELAAFFGQTSHETSRDTNAAGPFVWGYYFVIEIKKTDPPYYGRGPIQLTHKYNYEQAGRSSAINRDLVNHPDLVSSDPVISFKTAIWFWMTPQSPKPSCHDVITGRWNPSKDDKDAGRLPGYGVITNIINGGQECGSGQPNPSSMNRKQYYNKYCSMLGVSNGTHLGCKNQKPYN